MARAFTQCLRKFPQILTDIDLTEKKTPVIGGIRIAAK